MALVNVNADPQPGDAGYYDWHDRVAASHNKLKAALDAAANGDLLGADANNEPKAIASGTFAKVRDTALVLTVGSGGDHSTIGAALDAASRLQLAYVKNGLNIEVRLLDGFVMEEQVVIRRGPSLAHVRLTAEDGAGNVAPSNVVTMARSAITDSFGASTAGFSILDGGIGPHIEVRFDMDTSGTNTDADGFHLLDGGRISFANGSGCINASRRNLDIQHQSTVEGRLGVFDGAGSVGVRIGNMSHFSGRGGSAKNCGFAGVSAGAGSGHLTEFDASGSDIGINVHGPAVIKARDAVLTGAANHGARCANGGVLDLQGANTRKGASDSPQDTEVLTGGIINAEGLTGGLSQPANKVTGNGVIFQASAPDSDVKQRVLDRLDDLVVYEPFDTDAADLGTLSTPSGNAWTVHQGGIDVASGQARRSSGDPIATVDVGADVGDAMEMGFDFPLSPASAGREPGLAIWYVDLSNHFYAVPVAQDDGSVSAVRLYKVISGTETNVFSTNVSAGAGMYGRLIVRTLLVVGSLARVGVYLHDQLINSHELTATERGAIETSTRYGLFGRIPLDNNARWDNFYVKQLRVA